MGAESFVICFSCERVLQATDAVKAKALPSYATVEDLQDTTKFLDVHVCAKCAKGDSDDEE